jgi:hypothetical protein
MVANAALILCSLDIKFPVVIESPPFVSPWGMRPGNPTRNVAQVKDLESVATASQLHRGCNRITVAPSKLQGGPRALTKRILDGAMARLDQLHELVREIPTLPRFSVADEFPSTVT